MIEFKVYANGRTQPQIDDLSVIVQAKINSIDIGVLSLKEDSLDVFVILTVNKSSEIFTLIMHENDINLNKLYLIDEIVTKAIFGELNFTQFKVNDFRHEKGILLDQEMLLYGTIFEKECSVDFSNPDYKYIHSFLYHLIEIYRPDFLELSEERQILLEVPQEIQMILVGNGR